MSNIIEDSSKIIPEIYGDGLKPAVQSAGGILQLIPRAIRAAMLPFEKWIRTREYNMKEVERLLAAKLEGISPDEIVPPEPHIAIPALDALSYSMDSEQLREMYANLLARAMTSSSKDLVHPGFVDTIKQMTPLDASNMKYIDSSHALAKLRLFLFYGGYVERFPNIFYANPENSDYATQATSISNLSRLGLLTISYENSLVKEKFYAPFDSFEMYQKLIFEAPPPEVVAKYTSPSDDGRFIRVEMVRGYCTITPFGEDFRKVCIL